MDSIEKYINSIVDEKIKAKQLLSREAAIVKTVSEDYRRAEVELTNGSRLELLNKSGEKLAANDSVWVEYRTTPDSGYIAMRNGEADPLSEGGGGVLRIENAAIITPEDAAQLVTDPEAVNVDGQQRVIYGSLSSKFIVDGHVSFLYSGSFPSLATFQEMVTTGDIVSSDIINQNGQIISETISLQSIALSSAGTFSVTVGVTRTLNGSATASSVTIGGMADLPDELGLIFISTQILTTAFGPYGAARGTRAAVAIKNGTVIGAAEVNNNTYVYARSFRSQAEQDFALGITTRCEPEEVVT